MKRSVLKSLKKEASTLLTLHLFLKANTRNFSTTGKLTESRVSEFGVIFTDAA